MDNQTAYAQANNIVWKNLVSEKLSYNMMFSKNVVNINDDINRMHADLIDTITVSAKSLGIWKSKFNKKRS